MDAYRKTEQKKECRIELELLVRKNITTEIFGGSYQIGIYGMNVDQENNIWVSSNHSENFCKFDKQWKLIDIYKPKREHSSDQMIKIISNIRDVNFFQDKVYAADAGYSTYFGPIGPNIHVFDKAGFKYQHTISLEYKSFCPVRIIFHGGKMVVGWGPNSSSEPYLIEIFAGETRLEVHEFEETKDIFTYNGDLYLLGGYPGKDNELLRLDDEFKIDRRTPLGQLPACLGQIKVCPDSSGTLFSSGFIYNHDTDSHEPVLFAGELNGVIHETPALNNLLYPIVVDNNGYLTGIEESKRKIYGVKYKIRKIVLDRIITPKPQSLKTEI